MSEKKTEKGFKMEIVFDVEGEKRLAELREKSGATGNADLIQRSLRLYEWYVDKTKEGAKLLVQQNGKTHQITLQF